MKIGIFGGTYDPIHKAHVDMATLVIEEFNLDKLFFVPTNISPFKSNLKSMDALHRIKMIENVLPEKCEISLFEINRKTISYTIDTVRHFKQKFPDANLFLIIGSDHIRNLHKWKEIDEISQLVTFVCVKRKDDLSYKTNIKKYGIISLKNIPIDYSSSEFRGGKFDGVDIKNRNYIAENFLYLDQIAKNVLSGPRYVHSKSTAKLASEYAKVVGYDSKNAYVAGLVHDITKEWPEKRARKFLIKHGMDSSKIPAKVLHQYTGALWFEHSYLSKNKEIIKAISNHTTASIEMSVLDKIVFLADKLCVGRKFDGIQQERQIALKNLDEAFKRAIKRMETHLLSKNVEIGSDFHTIIEKWK